MGLRLENEVAVVKTPTIILYNPVLKQKLTDRTEYKHSGKVVTHKKT
jgi:hypothetical protein